MARDPRQLELPGIEPAPEEEPEEGGTTEPELHDGALELTQAELKLVHSLCMTGRDFLRGKLLTGQIPDKQVPVIRDVCTSGDAVIEKLEQAVNVRRH